MAQSIVQRLRGILSSKKDDYFNDLDLLDYVNEGYKAIISRGIKLEISQPKKRGRSIRALDGLRNSTEQTGLSFTPYRAYNQAEIDLDALNLSNLLYITAIVGVDSIMCSELMSANKNELDWGLLFPTEQQIYYEFFMKDGARHIRLICPKTIGASTKFQLDYFAYPVLISEADISLPELPDRLIHAVVLKAAVFAGIQETRENAKDFKALFDEEISEHLW